MRVIAGKHRSRHLQTIKDTSVRPTADFVKEALFNILGNKIIGADVLDLFCGSGSLGIESLSRGAKSAVFVDNSRKSVDICKQNLKNLNEFCVVNLSDYKSFLAKTSKKFDVIFLDPPYDKGIGENAVSLIISNGILNDGGIIVLEDLQAGKEVLGSLIFDFRKYGNTALTFYKVN